MSFIKQKYCMLYILRNVRLNQWHLTQDDCLPLALLLP